MALPTPRLDGMLRYLEREYAGRVARGRSRRYARETLSRIVRGLLAERLRDTLAEIGCDLAGKRVLDLGSGLGELPYHFPRFGARVAALDADGEALRLGRAWVLDAGHPAPWCRASGERLPFADGSFDVVVCNHVIEHTARPERVVAEALRVARPDGLVYLAAPNYRVPFEHHYELWWVPLLPRPWARRYLRLRGRSAADFERLRFVDRRWLQRTLAQCGAAEVVDLAELKLRQPALIRSPGRRAVARVLCGLGLARWAAALSPSIEVAVRRNGGP